MGESCAEYREALEKYRKAKETVGIQNIKALRDFCKKYALEELDFRRFTYIAEAGYTEDEYEDFKKGNVSA